MHSSLRERSVLFGSLSIAQWVCLEMASGMSLMLLLRRRQAEALREAFRNRDRKYATHIALEVYGIDAPTMETALGR